MASQFAKFSRARFGTPRPAPRLVRMERPPVPGSLVDAVLRFHDEAQDQGSGRTLLRLSAKRLHEPEVEAALGELAPRAGRVSILWNERESEIIRVLEAA